MTRHKFSVQLCAICSFVLQDGWSALHFSAWAGRQAVLQELLQHGADVNLQDKVSQHSLTEHLFLIVHLYLNTIIHRRSD